MTSRYRFRLFYLLAFLLLPAMLASCTTTEEATPETVAAITTAAPDADVVVSFDGTSCVNTGQPLLSEGGAKIHYANLTEEKMQFSVHWFRFQAGFQGALAAIPEGTDKEGIIAFPAGARVVSWLRAEPLQDHTELVLLEPGWYTVNCFLVPQGETNPTRLWRAESFEVISSTGDGE